MGVSDILDVRVHGVHETAGEGAASLCGGQVETHGHMDTCKSLQRRGGGTPLNTRYSSLTQMDFSPPGASQTKHVPHNDRNGPDYFENTSLFTPLVYLAL